MKTFLVLINFIKFYRHKYEYQFWPPLALILIFRKIFKNMAKTFQLFKNIVHFIKYLRSKLFFITEIIKVTKDLVHFIKKVGSQNIYILQ